MKKKILIAVAVILVVGLSLTFYFTQYMSDSKDTQALYMENINAVGYENTVETAIPQTALYDIINEHFASELPEGKIEKKAIVIGYDGCRADILALMQKDKSAIGALLEDGASINLSYCGGVNYPEENTQDTSTAPGWCSILTGEWADVHGITGNDITKSMQTKTLLTSLTEDGIIDDAAFITKWAGHFSRDNATYLLEKEYCEEKGLDVDFNKCKNDEASFEAAIAEIGQQNCADFIFVIYEPTDATGHNYGFTFNNPGYKKAFLTADNYGFETINAIKARENYEKEDWLIIVTSDHGGIGTQHGKESIQERMTFIVMNAEL